MRIRAPSYEKMSTHKRLFKQKSQSLFDNCHNPFDLLLIGAFVSLFTETFAKMKVLLIEVKTCNSPGILVKMFGLPCATAIFFFFWWSDSNPGRKKNNSLGLSSSVPQNSKCAKNRRKTPSRRNLQITEVCPPDHGFRIVSFGKC